MTGILASSGSTSPQVLLPGEQLPLWRQQGHIFVTTSDGRVGSDIVRITV